MTRRSLGIVIAGLLLASALVLRFLPGHSETEEDRERGVKGPRRVTIEKGEVIVTLDAAAQAEAGIAADPLAAARRRDEERAYGVVLDAGQIADLRVKHATVRAEAEQARARLEASRKEHERVKALHEEDQNASAKALETAEAAFRADAAAATAASASLEGLEARAAEAWGPIVRGWLRGSSPELTRVLDREEVLVQLTLPPGAALPQPPATASLETAHGEREEARLVSLVPRTDPSIQGQSLLYLARARPDLLPGMNVTGFLPLGAEIHGAVVPEAAVVRWMGKGWAYVEHEPGRFARREVSTDRPTSGGYLVTTIAAGARVVTRGAQALLSEESRAPISLEER